MWTRTYHIEGDEGIELDEAVEVSKGNRDGQEHDIARISYEESGKLHDFREAENEDNLSPEGILATRWVPIGGCLPERKDDEGIHNEG